jgi:hypothetical protein
MAIRLKSANSGYHKVVMGLTKNITPTSDNENQYIEKGVHVLNMDEIKSTLFSLKNVANEKTKNLKDNDKKLFNKIVQNVQRYYDLPEQYGKLYSSFVEVFGEFKDRLEPGTVASYIVGCANRSSSCVPVCAGSAPHPEATESCEARVIWAYNDNNNYTLISLQPSPSKNAIIYIDARENFMGFGDREKDQLREWDIENVVIATFDRSQNQYKELIPLSSVDNIKPRLAVIPSGINASSGSSTIFYILLLILLIIVFYIGWKMYNSRY